MPAGGGVLDGGKSAWPATRWLARRWLRRRSVGVLPLLVVVLIGTAATVIALDSAQRTSSAFTRHLERANAGDVVVNPSVSTAEIDEVIRSLPGITQITTESLFMVTHDDGAPRTGNEVDQGGVESGALTGVFGSADGRYAVMDRPVVRAGRLPTGPAELALSASAAESERIEIGDVVPLAFWQAGFEQRLVGLRADEVIEPIGVEYLTVVGLLTFRDEVLPHEFYSRARAIVSPDIASRYDCDPPTLDPTLSLADNIALAFPEDCAVSYRYYSLSFADGADGVKPALDEFVRRAAPLNVELAKIVDTSGQGADAPDYFLISQETEPQRQRVERATRTTVAALSVLAAAASAMTVAVAGLLVGREMRQTRPAQQQWRQLGLTRRERATVAAGPAAGAIVAGIVAGLGIAGFARVGAIGVVEPLEPEPSRGLGTSSMLAAVAIGALCLALALLLAMRATRLEPAMGSARRRWIDHRLSALAAPPPVAEGIRAAFGRRAAAPVIAGSGLVAAALVAALVFGANLSALVGTQRAYGWPWDLAALTGGGYGDLDLDAAREAFSADPAVAGWTAFGFMNEPAIDGEPTMSVIGVEQEAPAVDFPLVAGKLPTRPDEIALGVNTAGERGLDVGDTVRLGGPFEAFDVTITGLVVFPAVGPMFAESVGAGTGMLLPQALVDAVAPVPNAAASLATFVGVELADGADEAATARIHDALAGLDVFGYPPIQLEGPVRPPEVVEVAATRSVPLAIGAALAALGTLGLGVAGWSSVNARRRDLAILRALGFTRGQVRSTVRTQSMATAVVAVAIGVALGTVAGRLAWEAFTRELGVLPNTTSAWPTVGGVMVGAVVVSIVVAQLPARRAANAPPAVGLRVE
jgi:hypothetical protein